MSASSDSFRPKNIVRRISKSGATHGVLAGLGSPAYILFILICLFLLPFSAFSQNKKELENRRKKLMRDIEVTNGLLKKTTKTKEATYDRYVTLRSQIQRRERLIQTIENEITAAENGIERNIAVTTSLNQDIRRMQEEYGRTVRGAFRRKTLSNPLLYILSAESLNQAFRRWLFLRKYDQFRRDQAEAIAATRKMLSKKIASLEDTRLEKENLLASLRGQKTLLTVELSDKNSLLKDLAQDESRLKTDLQRKQVAHEALNQAIEKIIQEEVSKRIAESRNAKSPPSKSNTPNSGTNNSASTNSATDKVEDAATIAFRQKRGLLPSPVENGFISRSYGRQKHPTLKNIEITNNGIDIRTDPSAAVRAVHEGRVAGVQFIPGHDYTVIIQHGNYYTVYSNLSETSVAKGDQVRAKQTIGKVSSNSITGTSELHFEVWNQKERMNPAFWIRN